MSTRRTTPGLSFVRSRRGLAVVVVAAAGAASALTVGAHPAHAVTGFTAGDLVVYRVGDGSGALSANGAAVFLDEYTPSGALVQSVALPTSVSGSNKPLVASGSANSEGLLTLSSNDQYLVATGYDAAVGTSGLSGSAAASVPRTVATVSGTDTVNSTTALTDFADGNNPRSATSVDGTHVWVAGAAGSVRYAALGATTSTAVTSSTYKNIRQVSIYNGQLYASADPTKAGLTVGSVGTGLPTSGSLTPTNLSFSSAPTEPFAYAFVTLGSGTAPDTLYVADNSAGAIVKYVLSGGNWVAKGSVSVPNVTGVTANDTNGTVSIFATTSGSAGTTGQMYSMTDTSGAGGTLSGTASLIVTAGANKAFRGVAFAPGTVFGSGGPVTPPPPPAPTITLAQANLPAAIGDPTNPTLGITVADTGVDPSTISVTASSSNTAVAPQGGLSVTAGAAGSRTLTVTPGGTVGYSTITLTATAPGSGGASGTSTTTTLVYGLSANLGDASDRYFSGAGNASAAIDVGGGYMIVGDDESNVLRLYNETQSGPPVKTFDFTSQLPNGTTEIDIEAAARSGNTLYWEGSMGTTSSGNLAPARSTLFAATISGSGANTTLTYVGSYTNLKSDVISWDANNGHGLGANYLGLAASAAQGVDGHGVNALNVEGMEFASPTSSTAYLTFRSPLEPTTNRHLALVVPVTNLTSLVTGQATQATFGAPLFWNLGGLGVRDIKENSAGQFLVIAGTADGSNSSFVLYTWDGNPADQPVPTNTPLPLIPSGANQGSWETIVSVPNPLTSSSTVQLLEDNGDTAWYGDTATSKDTLQIDLQKDLGRVFAYSPPTPNPVTFTATNQSRAYGTPDPTFTYTVTGLSGSDTVTTPPTCVVTGSDTAVGTYPITCSGAATSGSNDSITYVAGTLTVTKAPVVVTVASGSKRIVTGQSVTYTAKVAPSGTSTGATPTGTVEFKVDGTDATGCSAVSLSGGSASCTLPSGVAAGSHSVVAYYSGDGSYTTGDNSAAPLAVTVFQAATTTSVSADISPAVTGQTVTFTATVGVVTPGTTNAGAPTGTIDFTVDGVDATGCASVTLSAGVATCAVSGLSTGSHNVVASYSGDTSFLASDDSATPYVEVVNAAGTTTVVTADNNPVVTGQSVTFTATVTPSGSASGPTPTGTVEFMAGGTDLTGCASVSLSSEQATCTVAGGFIAGSESIVASYSGDSSYNAGDNSATPLTETVKVAGTTTTVFAGTAVTGQPVTLSIAVKVASPGSTTPASPGGTAAVKVDGNVVPGCGSVAVSAGRASCTVPTGFVVGSHPVVADYLGDANFAASDNSAAPASEVVSPATTFTTVDVTPGTAVTGQSITIVATVAPVSPGTTNAVGPGGTVEFEADGADLPGCSSVAVDSSGSATCVDQGDLTAGSHAIVAVYSGDANFAGGTGTSSANVTPATYVFVNENPSGPNQVENYRVNGDGTTTLIGTYPTGHPGSDASWVVAGRSALARTGNHLYALNLGDLTVTVFTVNPTTGALTLVGTTPSLDATVIAVNPTGTTLYAGGSANSGSANQLASYAIGSDGMVASTPEATVSGDMDGLSVSPDGSEVAAAYPGTSPTAPNVTVWTTDAAGDLTADATINEACPTDVRFVDNNTLDSASCYAGELDSYSLSSGQLTVTSSAPTTSQTLAIGADGTAFFDTAAGLQGAEPSGASFASGPTTSYPVSNSITSMSITPDGSQLFVASFNDTTINDYAIGSDESLTLLGQLAVPAGSLPSVVAYTPTA